MGITMADHLYRRLLPKTTGYIPMNFSKMAVQYAQVLEKKRVTPQYIQAEARIDLDANQTNVYWFNVDDHGARAAEHFASATIHYEDSNVWEEKWERMAQLISGRIDSLAQSLESPATSNTTVSRLSNTMVYNLFQNVVAYADHFRGMRSVVLAGFEAYADVVLDADLHGSWYAPPHYTDPACHLSGFIMNGSDAVNTRDFFYVTHGWDSWRALEPLESGVTYKSYVKMVPVRDEAHMYAGDVYLLKDGRIVAEVSRMRFKRIPRQLMKNFFSPGQGLVKSHHRMPQVVSPQPYVPLKKILPSANGSNVNLAPVQSWKGGKMSSALPTPEFTPQHSRQPSRQPSPLPTRRPSPVQHARAPPSPPIQARDVSSGSGTNSAATSENAKVDKCMEIIAQEVGVEMAELTDDAVLAEFGVDSLLSLVLAEKLTNELRIDVKSSIFLEFETVADLKEWIVENS
jgi:asperthecin polyketide synthase